MTSKELNDVAMNRAQMYSCLSNRYYELYQETGDKLYFDSWKEANSKWSFYFDVVMFVCEVGFDHLQKDSDGTKEEVA